MKPEIRKVLVCSTSHVTRRVAEALDGNHLCIDGICWNNVEYGWLVRYWNSKQEPNSIEWKCTPVCMKHVIAKAEELGCSMILFDCDADTLDGVKTFDW